jgi:hypothetical protein
VAEGRGIFSKHELGLKGFLFQVSSSLFEKFEKFEEFGIWLLEFGTWNLVFEALALSLLAKPSPCRPSQSPRLVAPHKALALSTITS